MSQVETYITEIFQHVDLAYKESIETLLSLEDTLSQGPIDEQSWANTIEQIEAAQQNILEKGDICRKKAKNLNRSICRYAGLNSKEREPMPIAEPLNDIERNSEDDMAMMMLIWDYATSTGRKLDGRFAVDEPTFNCTPDLLDELRSLLNGNSDQATEFLLKVRSLTMYDQSQLLDFELHLSFYIAKLRNLENSLGNHGSRVWTVIQSIRDLTASMQPLDYPRKKLGQMVMDIIQSTDAEGLPQWPTPSQAEIKFKLIWQLLSTALSPYSVVRKLILLCCAGLIAEPVLASSSWQPQGLLSEFPDELEVEVTLPAWLLQHPVFVCPILKVAWQKDDAEPILLECGHMLSEAAANHLRTHHRNSEPANSVNCAYCSSQIHWNSVQKFKIHAELRTETRTQRRRGTFTPENTTLEICE